MLDSRSHCCCVFRTGNSKGEFGVCACACLWGIYCNTPTATNGNSSRGVRVYTCHLRSHACMNYCTSVHKLAIHYHFYGHLCTLDFSGDMCLFLSDILHDDQYVRDQDSHFMQRINIPLWTCYFTSLRKTDWAAENMTPFKKMGIVSFRLLSIRLLRTNLCQVTYSTNS